MIRRLFRFAARLLKTLSKSASSVFLFLLLGAFTLLLTLWFMLGASGTGQTYLCLSESALPAQDSPPPTEWKCLSFTRSNPAASAP